MNVVVVESPAKAKTINKYLGKDFTVLASYGHVRDLPSKDGSVRPDEDFAMSWQMQGRAKERIGAIAKALKGADTLYLATDPDREGEAISWHVIQTLKSLGALDGVDIHRVVFNQITRNAVLEAMEHPRELNRELVDAYLARRALDYLVGFTLSPVLWRKVPGSRSAGRVQSVALRLICEREAEIEAFKAQEYWTVEVNFNTGEAAPVVARLTHLDGQKLGKLDLKDEAAAGRAVAAIEARQFAVSSIERKTVRRHPPPPFITSTLQQEASRKLGFGATRTMRLAQRLYEGISLDGETVGLITYMRTDSVQMAGEALAAARRVIGDRFGPAYVPEKPRAYRSSAKNAQEAHEAIRPTELGRLPDHLRRHLDGELLALYDLIWKRALASQMNSAELEQVGVDITAPDEARKQGLVLRATGSIVTFDGFLTLYQEGQDDPGDETGEARLPPLKEGQALSRGAINPQQHFTQPPPRYTEASVVKRLEELGIGRPSTYATILQVLQDRNYVSLEKRRLIPSDRGRIVTAFLTNFFSHYVEYDFTAQLEDQLDEVSDGRIDWKKLLADFWRDFSKVVGETKPLTITQVIDALDADLGPHFFPETPETPNPRACRSCQDGRLGLKLGKFGAFIGCSNYPDCTYTRALAVPEGDEAGGALEAGGSKSLGSDPGTGDEITLRRGPYGYYVQRGEADKKAKTKPKRTSLPKGTAPEDVDLEMALGLLSLPREVGIHPESGEPITAAIGRFGPYLKHEGSFASLGADDDVLGVGLNRAVTLLAEAKNRRRGSGKELGAHPDDQKPVYLKKGRFGPYVSHGSTRASLPGDRDETKLTLDEAVELLAAKAAKGGSKKSPPKKSTPKKNTGKKSAARKSAPTPPAGDTPMDDSTA